MSPYSFLQDIIGNAINMERERLETIIALNVTDMILETLDKLLRTKDGMYELTLLKKEPYFLIFGWIMRKYKLLSC